MTKEELYEIFNKKNKKYTLKEIKQIIYEFKEICTEASLGYAKEKKNERITVNNNFHMGEAGAYDICLYLLDHLETD